MGGWWESCGRMVGGRWEGEWEDGCRVCRYIFSELLAWNKRTPELHHTMNWPRQHSSGINVADHHWDSRMAGRKWGLFGRGRKDLRPGGP